MRLLRLSLLTLLGLFIGYVGLSTAQRPGDITELIYSNEIDKFDANQRIEFDNYLSGRRQPSGDQAKRLFDLGARVYVWRVTMQPAQVHPDLMEVVRKAFRREIEIAVTADKDNKEAVRQWAPRLVSAFKKVFELPSDKNRLAIINAAVLLPDLATLKQPVISEFLVDLVKDTKKNDAVRFWAAKALKEVPPATEYIAINIKEGKAAEQRKAVDLRRIEALLALFGRDWVAPKQNPNEKKADYEKRLREYEDGFRWVRQGAIEALAEARVPAIEADFKHKKLTAPVAPVYLRVLTKGSGLNPEPSLHEKLEAAIGVCLIKVNPNSIYQPEEGIYRVGTFLVELADAYVADYNVSFGPQAKSSWMMPWKFHGKRLSTAMGELVQSVTDNPLHQGAAENARKLEKASRAFLSAIQGPRGFNAGGDLAREVNGLRPTSNQIFKGIAPATGNGE